MAFQAHSSFSEFSSSQETRTAYVERLEQYLAANKIEDADQQRAILLSVCGPATYRLICSLLSPKKPAELKFKDIAEIVQKHHDPKPSVIVQRYRFNTVIVVLENRSQHMLQSFANSKIIVILALPCSRCYKIDSFVALRTLKYSGDY